MSPLAAIPLFLVSLIVTLGAARLFARRLDRLGVRFRFPEALIGLLTAVAADGPEISSALFALVRGAHDVSTGVLVGSCAFNLAAMIGLSAVLTGCVLLTRAALLVEGLVLAAITLVAAALLLGWIPAGVAAGAAAMVLVPYVALVVRGPRLLASLRKRDPVLEDVAHALEEPPRREAPDAGGSSPTHHLLGLIVVDVALIIAGSVGMVQAALALGDRWHVSRSVLGMLILGPLTSLPNAATAIRLGLAGRDVALVGETFNSNTINLAVGVILPALFVAVTAFGTTATIQLVWMVAMTAACLVMLARRGGLDRSRGLLLIAAYAGFATFTLARA